MGDFLKRKLKCLFLGIPLNLFSIIVANKSQHKHNSPSEFILGNDNLNQRNC